MSFQLDPNVPWLALGGRRGATATAQSLTPLEQQQLQHRQRLFEQNIQQEELDTAQQTLKLQMEGMKWAEQVTSAAVRVAQGINHDGSNFTQIRETIARFAPEAAEALGETYDPERFEAFLHQGLTAPQYFQHVQDRLQEAYNGDTLYAVTGLLGGADSGNPEQDDAMWQMGMTIAQGLRLDPRLLAPFGQTRSEQGVALAKRARAAAEQTKKTTGTNEPDLFSIEGLLSGNSDLAKQVRARLLARLGKPVGSTVTMEDIEQAGGPALVGQLWDQELQRNKAVTTIVQPKPEGFTPLQRFDREQQLAQRWQKYSGEVRQMRRSLSLMRAGVDAARKGDAVAGSQAVLVTFQKILDPTSVVRESEYARSASGLRILSQIEGAYERLLVSGGAGVPVRDLEQFVRLGDEFVKNAEASVAEERRRLETVANDYGLDVSNIFGGRSSSQPAPQAPAPSRTRSKYKIEDVKR